MEMFYGRSSSDKAKAAYSGIEFSKLEKPYSLGEYNTYHLISDPKRIGFLLARYKFVAKMFDKYERVLEVGCQEGLGSMVVAKSVGTLVAIDFYRPHIETCLRDTAGFVKNIDFRGYDINDGPIEENFDGAYSLDVFEHIDPGQEDLYMTHTVKSLANHGAFILGTPSLESQKYASEESKAGHINCKSGEELRSFCQKYFHNVFMFGMNDEVVHTGFLPMAHYLFALCVSPKR
ncbi:MAG: class I SAM-dependent methyltransferase [Clostridia bacterium]|nr:class I SAM-dependent methyltransferase [Clostridia bacterium]